MFKRLQLCILKKEKGRKQRYTTVSAFCLWHSNAKTKGYGQNIAHSLVHIIIARKANTLKRVHYSLGFPMKSKCAFYTLYSAQCFIGMDCTELIFFFRWSVKWKFMFMRYLLLRSVASVLNNTMKSSICQSHFHTCIDPFVKFQENRIIGYSK